MAEQPKTDGQTIDGQIVSSKQQARTWVLVNSETMAAEGVWEDEDQIRPETDAYAGGSGEWEELEEVEQPNGGGAYPGRFERLSEEQLKTGMSPVSSSGQEVVEREGEQDDDTEDGEEDDECEWCHKGLCLSPLPLDRCWERRSIYVSATVERKGTMS